MRSLTGTGRLVRLALRRDRVRITVWLAALVLGSLATAAAFPGLFETPEDREVVAQTMATPGGLAFTGPVRYLDDYNFGSMMGHQMLGFTALLLAIMTVLMVTRHTRAEEESGRSELVRANIVGRHAHLTAALIVALIANLVLALLVAGTMGSLGLEGITWSGSLLYGLAHAAVGVAFAGIAAVTVQVTEHSRGASGIAMALIGLAYILRMAGDITESGLVWLSPIGWAQATFVYVDDRWWPLLLAAGFTGVVGALGYFLSTRRDLGAGLRRTRPGPPDASPGLLRPVGLSLRIHRGLLVGFAIGMLVLGASYGSVMGEVETTIEAMGELGAAVVEMGGATLVESFASLISYVMAISAAIYVVLAALRPKGEENAGRTEPLLAASLSRSRWLAGHLAVAFVGGALVIAAAGLGLSVTAAAAVGDWDLLPRLFSASLVYIPAIWVTVGATVLLYGLLPRATVLAWLIPVYSFVVGYLGSILQFPEWTQNLTPYGWVPQIPAADMEWMPLLVLLVVAASLTAAGVAAFRRRDLISTA